MLFCKCRNGLDFVLVVPITRHVNERRGVVGSGCERGGWVGRYVGEEREEGVTVGSGLIHSQGFNSIQKGCDNKGQQENRGREGSE